MQARLLDDRLAVPEVVFVETDDEGRFTLPRLPPFKTRLHVAPELSFFAAQVDVEIAPGTRAPGSVDLGVLTLPDDTRTLTVPVDCVASLPLLAADGFFSGTFTATVSGSADQTLDDPRAQAQWRLWPSRPTSIALAFVVDYLPDTVTLPIPGGTRRFTLEAVDGVFTVFPVLSGGPGQTDVVVADEFQWQGEAAPGADGSVQLGLEARFVIDDLDGTGTVVATSSGISSCNFGSIEAHF